ncbi:MAG: hypothetical protein LQ341_001547 [Variospora aurantia]|nr:MAG: hypothetical protein LQ341_001547 [Variospora aurantia]
MSDLMEGDRSSGSEAGYSSEEVVHRRLKRRRCGASVTREAAANGDDDGGEPSSSSVHQSPGKDKENEDPEKAKKPKYRIHEPKNSTMPLDTFLTQPPSRSPSPYRINKFCWQKPQRPVLPTEVAQVTLQGGRLAQLKSKAKEIAGRPSIEPQRPTTDEPPRAADKIVFAEPQSSGADYDDDYNDVMADLPSDAFSSPEPAVAISNVPIEVSSQDPEPQTWASQSHRNPVLAAPLNNLRQTTLFGAQADDSNSQTQSARKRNWPLASKQESLTHHKIDREAMRTWVYPINLGKIRDYQYSIVAKGLFHNMLVALPTGLGKTFIAATIMLNWFRWTTDAQIVFVAPTKPLVSQQVKACFEIAGIPRSVTTMLTGNTPPGVRAEEWSSKRVFFMTPQTIVNDLKAGICDPKRVVLLVVDEAHRATGGYAYVEVVTFLQRFNTSFRVLALTATPGASIESVQEVINGLNISRIEIRTEESIDIREYVYARKIDTVLFEFSEEMILIMDLFAEALRPLVDKLCGLNAYWSKDPMALTPYGCTQARQRWMTSDAGRKANWGLKNMVITVFSLLASLSHGIELLKFHGIGPFYLKTHAFQNEERDASGKKSNKHAMQVKDSGPFQKMMSTLRAWTNNPDFVGHPKLEYLQTVVLNHFLDAGEGRGASDPSGTRIMIFAHYRDSAEEIVRVLKRNEPMIRPRVFVGQANSKGSEGMDQKMQLGVIQKFKSGIYNTLVATSIGEEGLDIGEIDLIVCYDASASPVRMLQRMGRTGRKRAGNIVVTLMKGKEENNFIKAKDGYERMQKEIAAGTRFNYHEEQSYRIVPREIQPVVDKKVVDIPFENTQADLPEPSKRAKVPKRPPKKFHMPDGVRKGFVKASRLEGDERSDDLEVEARAQVRQESPVPLPRLSDVLLSAAEQRELERRYLDVQGDSSEIVENPRVDAFPALQREPRPTKHVPHGRRSERLIKTLRLTHQYTRRLEKDLGRSLHPDDREEALRQSEKRAAFFTSARLPRSRARSLTVAATVGTSIAEHRFEPSPGNSSPAFEQPRSKDIYEANQAGVLEDLGHMENLQSSIQARSTLPRNGTMFYQSGRLSPNVMSGSDEDLPDFSTLIKKPGTVSLAALVEKTKDAAVAQPRPRKKRKLVVEEDSDEE